MTWLLQEISAVDAVICDHLENLYKIKVMKDKT